MSTQHTAALVSAARAGDQRAQDELVGAHLPLVYNIVGRALNGSVDVDDVVQDTMLRALDGLGGLRSDESFRSWLVAIAMNRVRAHWQARSTGPDASGLEAARELADPGADFVDLTVVQLNLTGQRRETARATRWLEPDDRALLSLWWLECAGELTREEVAAALELSPQHTAVRVQRMKAQLESARVVERALDAQPPCEALRAVAGGWDGRPSALWRKRIARHARECLRCAGLWNGLVPAEGLLAGLALVPVSAAVLAAVHEASAVPVAFSYAASSSGAAQDPGAHAAGARGDAGRGAARKRRRTRRRVIAGGVAVLCVAGGGALYLADALPGSGESGTTAAAPGVPLAALSTAGAATPSASASGSPSASASASASPSPSASASASASASSSASASASASGGGSAKPAPSSSAPRPALAAPQGTVAQVIALVNNERSAAGCGPLKDDAQLRAAAQDHSDDMADRNFFAHTNPDGADPGQRITAAGYRWSTYGENIAMGQQTPAAVMDSWMKSPGHRANILNCSFKDIGVGVRQGAGGPWWTQDFGAH
ncbi:sigma-70 family RNA polymerase sigma factor [Streptomyces sp. NBC_00536]|uniref:sigma-70 family RNA polymerase sigma factor n=1 Tax=Streptomyces sp. NBC_00536 TaxID=2975769 RepID=UPI002E80247E|nr:sigma-70 family RNA polymerase sigma factor [Streptomyces sp. NBC_00536]WUC82637.1 sigma-70 family RNA polymerase sigma factor [Streptomyces sp. NBC_00536]